MPGSMHASAADSTTVQDCRQQAGRCSDRVDAASMCACVRAMRIGAHIGREGAAARARGFPAGGAGRRTVA